MIIEYTHGDRRATTERDARGVTYQVFEGDQQIWHKRVRFGQKARNRLGGFAFVEASREQDEVLRGS